MVGYKRKHIFIGIFLLFFVWLYIWTLPTIQTQGTIKIWDRNHTLLYESAEGTGKKQVISYDQLPQDLINAAVASEDNTFWSNKGVDSKAIFRSLLLNIKARKVISGASTITQQVARSAVLPSSSSRSIMKKIREVGIALRLQANYSKKEILTLYFNSVYFGNLSYGVQAAANTYFDKDVSQLSLAESALLIGLLSSPERRDPFTNLKDAKIKQADVLDQMVKQSYISSQDAVFAKQEELHFSAKKSTIKAPHFVQYVLEELQQINLKKNQGMNIQTTLDYPTYRLSEDIARIWVNRLKDEHDLSNAALVLLDNKTGAIINMLGGVDYTDHFHSGQVNMTTADRQPGSALKPVTYAAAFQQGFTPATLIYDVKKVYKTKKGEGYTPNNYDGRYHGLVLIREALASSYNLPAVEMLSRIGIARFLETARNLGITTLTEEGRYDLSLTLGGGEVRLLDLANVYASFARGGAMVSPYAIETVTTDEGKQIYTNEAEVARDGLGEQSKQIAYLITNILADPKARIPGFHEKNPLVLAVPAAVKTGTTTDWHDNWTVGYTPSYTVGVWVGNNDNHAMKSITGVVGAAPIWQQFFEEFLKGKPKEQFIRPEHISDVVICKSSGLLPDGLCVEKYTELFINGTEPKQVSHMHKKIYIDRRNNLLAGKDCETQYINEKVFTVYPPEVYSWAKETFQDTIPTQFSPLCSVADIQSQIPYISISYPRNKTVFESAPTLVTNEAIVFSVNVSDSIQDVKWYVDGKLLEQSDFFPFSASWKPVVGSHTVKAVGETITGKTITSETVSLTVVGYKENN